MRLRSLVTIPYLFIRFNYKHRVVISLFYVTIRGYDYTAGYPEKLNLSTKVA